MRASSRAGASPAQAGRRPDSARPSVTSSAYSRSPPTGQPAREPRHAHAVAQPVGEVGGRRLARHVRVRGEHDFLDPALLDAVEQLADAEVGRLDAVERRERAAEHVVEAAVLVRPLERDDVDRLLDDADDRAVAPRVGADRAELLLGQVAAVAAEAHALLHLRDRLAERERLLLRDREQVEREPLRGPGADPGQAGQLRDEVVDGGAEHQVRLPRQLTSAAPRTCPRRTGPLRTGARAGARRSRRTRGPQARAARPNAR